MRFAVDSNILVYAFVRDDLDKHEIAADIMVRAMTLDAVVTAQAIAEFLNVIRRKQPGLFDDARQQAKRWTIAFDVLATCADHVLSGGDFAAKHKLQLWDSIMWQVVRSAHAVLFLSEDLHDHLRIDGMAVLNPFNPANADELRRLLSSAENLPGG